MKNLAVLGSIAAAVLLLSEQAARATPLQVSLSSTAPNLSFLRVGDTFELKVSLSGLAAGQTLNFLKTDVAFASALLGTPSSLTAGTIVPGSSGFQASASPGTATGLYDASRASGASITNNGVFYDFQLTARASGSGIIELSPTPTSRPLSVGVGDPLSFRIVEPALAVPEPSSFILLLGITAGGLLTCGQRKLLSKW